MTQFIGFPHYGDEYKVMGLAPYGETASCRGHEADGAPRGRRHLRPRPAIFRHASGEGANYQVKDGIPSGGRLWSDALAVLLGPARDPAAPLEDRHRDIARSAQVTYENAFFQPAEAAHRRYGVDALVLAGGCALQLGGQRQGAGTLAVQKLYVQSAGGDAGGAISAAFATWHKIGGAA